MKEVNFTHNKLGHVAGGSVVDVTLKGSAANVRLMDPSNFNNYKAGRRHQHHGGIAAKFLVRLTVTRSGTWHVTVDMQGLRGTVRTGIRVIPSEAMKPLPPINNRPLRELPSLVRSLADEDAPEAKALSTSMRVPKSETCRFYVDDVCRSERRTYHSAHKDWAVKV